MGFDEEYVFYSTLADIEIAQIFIMLFIISKHLTTPFKPNNIVY
jgi:hypothetical protein